MRRLKINLIDLESASDTGSVMLSYYLDTEKGEVISVTDDERRLLERIYEAFYDEETETVDWEAAYQAEHVPEWQRARMRDAERVEAEFGSRFIAVPSQDSHEGYRDLEAFIETIRNPRLQETLERAISGHGAFRYFKDVLLDYPAERKRWFQFQQERLRQRMLDWLEAEGIEPIFEDEDP
jgi:hypothetical protein